MVSWLVSSSWENWTLYDGNEPVPLYDHEFRGSSLQLQILFLKWGLETTKRILGTDIHTFGSPGNAFDQDTPKALEKFPSLKVWLYGPRDTIQTNLFVLPRYWDIYLEPRVGDVINPEEFKNRWELYSNKYEAIVLQLHPNMYDNEDWTRLETIVQFLKSQPDVIFMTPYAYYLYKQSQKVEQLLNFATNFELFQNYPNPFNLSTTIEFSIPKRVNVKLVIYDISGRVVRTLIDGKELEPGLYRTEWDGRSDYGEYVASGVYLYQLQAGDFISSKKMILTK